uniref:ficolin-1-A-like n=1 Tax=Styela clava TaxID=7725 RepID=UPI001939D1C3|nr:ficolin-1-A-like [Styela clava]
MSTAETIFHSDIPDNTNGSKALPSNNNISETATVQQQKQKVTKDTAVRRGLIALTIFVSLVVGLVVFCLVIITQLQYEMRIMKERLENQEHQSSGQLKWLERNLTSEINNSFSELKMIANEDSRALYSKLQQHQLQINQSLERILHLNHSIELLVTATQDFPNGCTNVHRIYAKRQNTTGGVFDIYPESEHTSVEVYCDLETDGGGWFVFQRRMDGTEDFYRGWNDYVNGFGEKDKEMWLGLETMHQLTKNGSYELRVDLENFNGDTAHATYRAFSIASASDKYRLTLGDYNGTAGDSLAYHNNMQFSTKDSDNDQTSGSCAITCSGAWWYNSCHDSNLNGIYYQDGRDTAQSVSWHDWKFNRQSLKFSEMKFRKKT